jgi:hypothetical protein
MIQKDNGRYACALCGQVVDVPQGKQPLVVIKARSGEPNTRAITLDGVELHACPFTSKPRTLTVSSISALTSRSI